MSLHVTLLYPQWGTRKRLYGVCVRSVLLSGCQAVSAAVRPLCAVGLSGSCQAVTLGPDSDGAPRLSDSAVRLSDTCCLTVRESAVSAVRLSGTVRRCPGFAVRLSDQGSVLRPTTRRCSRASAPRRSAVRQLRSCILREMRVETVLSTMHDRFLGALGVHSVASHPGSGAKKRTQRAR